MKHGSGCGHVHRMVDQRRVVCGRGATGSVDDGARRARKIGGGQQGQGTRGQAGAPDTSAPARTAEAETERFITKRSKTMDTIPFTNRQSIVKVFVVWILGLAVLLGSSTVSLATQKWEVGHIYCFCDCDAGRTPTVGNNWEKRYSCALANGIKCTSRTVGDDKPINGVLKNCHECTINVNDYSCESGFPKPPLPPNGPGSEINPYRPGQNAPVESSPYLDPYSIPGNLPRSRGVEPESPVTPPAGQEEKTTVPK
jgi:hypothetical protein